MFIAVRFSVLLLVLAPSALFAAGAGMRIQAVPDDMLWQGPGNTGTVSIKTAQKKQADGSIMLERTETIRLAPGIVPPASYPILLELNRLLTQPAAWRVLLEDAGK
jgi:hypothetical protein